MFGRPRCEARAALFPGRPKFQVGPERSEDVPSSHHLALRIPHSAFRIPHYALRIASGAGPTPAAPAKSGFIPCSCLGAPAPPVGAGFRLNALQPVFFQSTLFTNPLTPHSS